MTEETDLNLMEIMQRFSTVDAAREWFEGVRWPNGAVCPHCESMDVVKMVPRLKTKKGRPGRKGLFHCRGCKDQFTVTIGTVFEDSHIPMNKWIIAFFMICSSKKGISAHQLHRMLKLTYKSAWFMAHRIRHAMETTPDEMMGGVVEIDETYVGGKPRHHAGEILKKGRRTGPDAKTPVLALVKRDGEVRTKVVADVTKDKLKRFIDANLLRNCTVNTDQFVLYKNIFYPWNDAQHRMVNHSKLEYARKEADGSTSHVNTAESFFSLIKRGIYGNFHHVSKEHLFRYCNEFAFRWNHRKLTDGERMEKAFEGTDGKRLTYRQAI